MSAIGILLAFVGALALVGGAVQKYKAGRLAKTPFVSTGDAASQKTAAAGEKGAISTQGKVAHGDLVTGEVTGTQALYVHLKVKAKWKVGDSNETLMLRDEKLAASFTLDDGSGPVAIDVTKGGDLELKKTFSKTKGLGLGGILKGGGIQFGEQGFAVAPGPRKYQNKIIPQDAKFEVTEECLIPAEQYFVCGKIDESGVIGSPSWASLILSTKTHEELAGGTAEFAKKLLIGGAVGVVVGGILAALG